MCLVEDAVEHRRSRPWLELDGHFERRRNRPDRAQLQALEHAALDPGDGRYGGSCGPCDVGLAPPTPDSRGAERNAEAQILHPATMPIAAYRRVTRVCRSRRERSRRGRQSVRVTFAM